MRWCVLIFLLLPSFATADKVTRDLLLSFANISTPCVAVFQLRLEDEFKKTQLLMQYEIDEELFSMEKIESYVQAFKIKISSYGQKINVSTLTDTEKEYLEIKTAPLVSASKDYAQKLISDPTKLSKEILYCVEKFELNN